MANDLFRDLISIARRYIDPFYAETLISDWCEKCGTTENDVSGKDLPSILLGVATDTTLLDTLRSHDFSEMMKKYMALSNRLEELDRKKMREVVRNHKAQGQKSSRSDSEESNNSEESIDSSSRQAGELDDSSRRHDKSRADSE